MDWVYQAWGYIQWVYNNYGPGLIDSLNNASRM